MAKLNEHPTAIRHRGRPKAPTPQMFRSGTVGEMILLPRPAHPYLVGEVSSVRIALGKAPVDDPIDQALDSFMTVPGVADQRVAGAADE